MFPVAASIDVSALNFTKCSMLCRVLWAVPCAVLCCVQVTNTPWGERVSFLFNPAGDTSPKALHVSPFMDMGNTW